MLNGTENGSCVCRLCLGKSADHCIFLDNESIIEKILSCCTLQIYENDGLPDHICKQCLNTLDIVVNFRNRCEENDRILREGLLNIKREKYDIPDVKVEFPEDFNDDDFANFGSDEFEDDIKPDKNMFNLSKKKMKKVLRRASKKKLHSPIFKTEDSDDDDDDSKPIKLKKDSKRDLNDANQSGLCSFCGKVFFKMSSLKAHLKLHTMEKNHNCTTCSKSFRDLRKLKDHEKTHLNIKDFPCEVCGKLFSSRNSAKKHLDAVHHKLKVATCSICNKKLASNRSLKGHMKTHTGEKEFECDICEQSFAFKCSLVVHLRCHTGEKPYSCKYCGARFAALKTIKEHERLHTGETPYLCPVCSKGFSQKSNMKSHFRNNHKGFDLT